MDRRYWCAIVLLIATCLTATTADAQWIAYPTPGLPRTPDGEPDLSAPIERAPDGRPDLTGLWTLSPAAVIAGALDAAGMQPWAVRRHEEYEAELGRNDTDVLCLPRGPRLITNTAFAKFVQTPRLLAILYEDLSYRQIFIDGRPLPTEPNPSWMGYSVGHWDGDTLVVASLGYTARSFLTSNGHPHTDALRITERFTRRDRGHMDVDVTIDDPGMLARPAIIPVEARLVPDTDLLEYVCNENERSRDHLVGTAADDASARVVVPVDVLAKYAGTYALTTPENVEVITFLVRDGQLIVRREGPGLEATAVPVSQTRFSAFGASIEFVPDASGNVSRLIVSIVEGDLEGIRTGDAPPPTP